MEWQYHDIYVVIPRYLKSIPYRHQFFDTAQVYLNHKNLNPLASLHENSIKKLLHGSSDNATGSNSYFSMLTFG